MSLKLNEKTNCGFAGGCLYAAGRNVCSVLLLVLLFVGFLSSTLFAQPKPSSPPPISNRFLFIIDTSSAMKRLQRDEMKVVYELLANSATGQMHSGDSVGFWTFNQDVHSDVPAQTWSAEHQGQIIQRTMNFLQQQHYAKSSRLEKALADMQDIVQASDIITVFIISSGHGKITGTPFDKEINALYKQSLADMKHDPKPVITVLQGKQGKIVHFTVNAMPWPVVVPEIPIPIRASQPLPAEANTNSPPENVLQAEQSSPAATASKHQSSTIPPSPPLLAVPPQVIAQPAPLPQRHMRVAPSAPPPINTLPVPLPPPALRPDFVTPGVASPPPQPAPPSNATQPTPPTEAPQTPLASPNASTPEASASPAQSPTQAGSPVPPAIKPPAILPPPPLANNNLRPTPAPSPQQNAQSNGESSNPSIATTVPPKPTLSLQAEPATNEAQTAESKHDAQPATAAPATNSLASRAYAFVSPQVNGRPKSLLIAGIALLLLALVLLIVMLRRSRATSGPSLISQTMGNGSKK